MYLEEAKLIRCLWRADYQRADVTNVDVATRYSNCWYESQRRPCLGDPQSLQRSEPFCISLNSYPAHR